MRMLLTVQMDTEKATKAIKDNRLPDILKAAMGRMQPEAAFFGAEDGNRTGFFVFDMKNASDIPAICEPLFAELGAKVSIIPVMNAQDVEDGLGRAGNG